MDYNFKLDDYNIEMGEALLGKGDVVKIQPLLAAKRVRIKVTVRKPQGCSWEVDVPLNGTRIEVKGHEECQVSFGLILELDDATNPNRIDGQITLSPGHLYNTQPQDVGTFTGTKG